MYYSTACCIKMNKKYVSSTGPEHQEGGGGGRGTIHPPSTFLHGKNKKKKMGIAKRKNTERETKEKLKEFQSRNY